MKLNNIKQILLTAADISMVILNISLAPLKRFHPTRSAFYDVVRVTFTSPRPHPRRPPQGVFKSPTCLQKPSAKVAPGPELLSLTCLDSISMSFDLHFLHFMLSTEVYKRDDVTLRERKVALHLPSLSV